MYMYIWTYIWNPRGFYTLPPTIQFSVFYVNIYVYFKKKMKEKPKISFWLFGEGLWVTSNNAQ